LNRSAPLSFLSDFTLRHRGGLRVKFGSHDLDVLGNERVFSERDFDEGGLGSARTRGEHVEGLVDFGREADGKFGGWHGLW
jgi:hypothetical protein